MGVTATAAVALVIAAFFAWRGKMRKTTALLMLAASGALTSGWMGSALDAVTSGAADLTGSATAAIFGVAVPALLGIAAAVWFFYDLWPGHAAGLVTIGLGLVLPWLVTAIPSSVGDFLASAVTWFSGATIGTLASVL